MKRLIPLYLWLATTPFAMADEIARLVEVLAKSHAWSNGGFPQLTAAKDAPVKEVLTEYCGKSSFPDGSRIREFSIVEARPVTIPGPLPDTYVAARCQTDHGPQIFILRHDGKAGHWWVKRFETKASGD